MHRYPCYGCTGAGIPYEYILLAGNVHGCGEQYHSPPFFTKEESMIVQNAMHASFVQKHASQ